MPKPKIASKTKAANRAAKQLGYKSAQECHNSGNPEHKRIVQDAFKNTSPR